MKHLKSEVASVHVFDVKGVPSIRTLGGLSFAPTEIAISLVGDRVAGFTITASRPKIGGDRVRLFTAADPYFRGPRIPLWLKASLHEARSIARRRSWTNEPDSPKEGE